MNASLACDPVSAVPPTACWMERILTVFPRSGSQSPGKDAVCSFSIWNGALLSATGGAGGGSGGESSNDSAPGISRPDRLIHARESPEMRTCTQLSLLSRISNSSSASARNSTFAPSLGLVRTGVPDFRTAARLVGCDWFRRISSRFLASFSRSSAWRSFSPLLGGGDAASAGFCSVPGKALRFADDGADGRFVTGADAPDLLLGAAGALVDEDTGLDGFAASASARRSSRSDSSRPLDAST